MEWGSFCEKRDALELRLCIAAKVCTTTMCQYTVHTIVYTELQCSGVWLATLYTSALLLHTMII
jgi:hypothetical protein